MAIKGRILVLLISGLIAKRQRKIKVHAWVMLVEVILYLISFAAAMDRLALKVYGKPVQS